MRGQLSAEMLILIVVVIAVVAIAASRLITTARSSSDTIENKSAQIGDMADKAVRNKEGGFCTEDVHCISDSCNKPETKCNA
jgi:Tfp pilus assembly protein PilX